MALFKKTDSFVGVDIGAGGIKLVELKKTKNRPQLWTYGIVSEDMNIHAGSTMDLSAEQHQQSMAIAGDTQDAQPEVKTNGPTSFALTSDQVDHYAAVLKELLKVSNVSTRHAVASIPVSKVFHAVITLPVSVQKDIDHHVRAKIKKMLPYPIEDMQVVYQPIPDTTENKKYVRLLVTAAPKDLVATYTEIFQKAGLQLMELETEAFALERSLVGKDNATMMVIDIGASRTNFFIVDKQLPITHRSIRLGSHDIEQILAERTGMTPEQARQAHYDLGFKQPSPEMVTIFAQLFDPVLKEIQSSFDLFLQQSGNEQKRPEKIVLTGGTSLFPPLQTVIEHAFSLKVFVGDPWARVVYQPRLKPVLDTLGPRMAAAIGLALRNIV